MDKKWTHIDKVYMVYTVMCMAVFCCLYFIFYINGKNFIWQNDGLYQHYNAFIYIGVYFRGIIKDLLEQHQFTIPMWEWGLGYGADVFQTLAYYVFGDPIALLSVVIPVRYAEQGYTVAILLRLYLAGISFLAYCKYWRTEQHAALCGALAYVFCAFALFAAIRHPYFTNPMIYLPLLLLGVEKILDERRPVLFIAMVFVSAISNFYFFYMIVLVTVVYVLVRYFSMYKRNWQGCCFFCARLFGYAVVGLLMAMILFLPVAMAFLESNRVTGSYVYDWLYSLKYYEKFGGSLISYASPGSWSYVGMAPIVLIGIFIFFVKEREKIWLKYLFVILVAFLLFPVVGHIFNGFGYVSNRWCWAYVFVGCFIFTLSVEKFVILRKKDKIKITAFFGGYILLCIIFQQTRTVAVLASCCLLLLGVLVILLVNDIELKIQPKKQKQLISISTLGFVIIGIILNGYSLYSPQGGNYVAEFKKRDTALAMLERDSYVITSLVKGKEFYRIESAEGNNPSIKQHLSFTGFYWSMVSSEIQDFYKLNSAYIGQTYNVKNLQQRALLLPFAFAKYYETKQADDPKLPYGYEYVGEKDNYENKKVYLYQTDYTLPLGYTTNQYISVSEYEALSFAQRQQAMLQSAVVEDTESVAITLEKNMPVYTDEMLSYTVKADSNITLKENQIVVKKADAKLTLSFECPADRELYLELQGLSFVSKNKAYEFISEKDWEKKSLLERAKIKYEQRYWVPADNTKLTAKAEDVSTAMTHYTDYNIYAHGRTDYLFNLCYSEEARTELTLTFSQPGIYSWDAMQVIAQPMDMLAPAIQEMTQDILQNVEISTNKITGDVSLEQSKLLCLSVPYSKGWKATVDGKSVDLLKTNIMYMGILLEPGEHEIQLQYTTPYIRIGMILTLLGWVMFFWVVFWHERKRNSKEGDKNV